MGALPKQRISKGRRNRRRSQHALTAASIGACPRCGARVMTHRVCPECGTYNGVTVIEPRSRNRST